MNATRTQLCLEALEDRISPAVSGGFHVAGGQILDPSGNPWVAKGINVPAYGGIPDPNQVLARFPGLTFVRVAATNYPSPASLANFVNTMTSHHVVVEIEDHPNPLVNPYSGTALTHEATWYSQMASAFRNNPYVWFGTQNEPQSVSGESAEQLAVYQAIRGAGNPAPVLLEAGPQGGIPEGVSGLNPNAYAGMTNVIWDMHFSGGDVPNLTTQSAIDSALVGYIQTAQQIHSANGTIPVIFGEFSPSTDSSNLNPNGQLAIYAATTWALQNGLTSGFAGWYWGTDPNDKDSMTHDGTTLTSWGQQVRSIIQNPLTQTPPASPPASPPPVSPPTAQHGHGHRSQVEAAVAIAVDSAEFVLSSYDTGHVLGLPDPGWLVQDVLFALPDAGALAAPAMKAGTDLADRVLGG